MPTKFRVVSFNAQNLFSRAKILNRRDHAEVAEKLKLVDELNELIHKPTNFTVAQKARIVELYQALREYITIRENRGRKLFNRDKTQVIVQSGKDWEGEIEFKRDNFSQLARDNTARVLKEVKADVACMIECEDRLALAAFNGEMLGAQKFKYAMLIDGNDPRGIDVGVLTKFAIVSLKTHIYDGPANSRVFSRDCLRVEMKLPEGQLLHILCNHFKSKSEGEARTDARRERQAKAVAQILTEYDLQNDLVIVAGDLNDTPDSSSPLRPLLDVNHLHDVLALQFPNDPAVRWTYYYQKTEQIDYLLVSDPLRAAFKKVGVERRGIAQLSKITGGAEREFETVTHWTNAASDHGAVWAEFSL